VKIKIYSTVIVHGCKTVIKIRIWSEVFENRLVKRILGAIRTLEGVSDRRKVHNAVFHNLRLLSDSLMLRLCCVCIGNYCISVVIIFLS
jgi:hypothetical protein